MCIFHVTFIAGTSSCLPFQSFKSSESGPVGASVLGTFSSSEQLSDIEGFLYYDAKIYFTDVCSGGIYSIFTLLYLKHNFKIHTFYFLIVFFLSKTRLRSTVQHFIDDF